MVYMYPWNWKKKSSGKKCKEKQSPVMLVEQKIFKWYCLFHGIMQLLFYIAKILTSHVLL